MVTTERFPLLTAHAEGRIAGEVARIADGLVGRFPRMPRAEAEAVAAARLYAAYGDEWGELQGASRNRTATPEELRLEEIIAMETGLLGEELQDLTGTRTLLADLDVSDDDLERAYAGKAPKVECPYHEDETKTGSFKPPQFIRNVGGGKQEYFCPECGRFLIV